MDARALGVFSCFFKKNLVNDFIPWCEEQDCLLAVAALAVADSDEGA